MTGSWQAEHDQARADTITLASNLWGGSGAQAQKKQILARSFAEGEKKLGHPAPQPD